MSDIFISYSRKDRARAKVLAGALERQGWSVWWDPKILPGERFAKIIKKELDKAKCIIVLWSKWSVESDWVQDEAAEGNRRHILVPAKIDDVEIPLGFKSIQAARLVDWEGKSPHPEFDTLLEAVRATLGQPLLSEASKPTIDKQRPKTGNVVTNSIGMKLVYIPAGSFMMGSRISAAQLAREYHEDEADFEDEFPRHEVRISKGFWMGQTEVTQGQYKSVMNVQAWSRKRNVQENANNPAVYVSWSDAVEFCRKLSQQDGKTYRLPTEAEWEYACRAGTTTRFSFGDSDSSLGDYAWFCDNTFGMDQKYAHSVGQKKPNPWGLYDVHGNVWEWCGDWYDENYYSDSPSVDPKGSSSGPSRCLRGGSWATAEADLRCSCRSVVPPNKRYKDVGFRVVRSQ